MNKYSYVFIPTFVFFVCFYPTFKVKKVLDDAYIKYGAIACDSVSSNYGCAQYVLCN